MSVEMEVPHGYSMLLTVHSWVYPDVQPVPESTGPEHFGRIITVAGSGVPVTVRQSAPGCVLEVSHPNNVSSSRVVSKIRWILGPDYDTTPALNVLRQDHVAAAFVDHIAGIRPYTSDTVYEGLMKSVIQQQVSYRAANVLTSKLVSFANRRMNVDGSPQAGFPTPNDLVAMGVDRLRAIGLGYKANYLYDISRMVTHGDLLTEDLLTTTYDEMVSILSSIRGIGTWTVQTLAIAALRMFDVFPYSDIGIRNLIGRLYNGGIRVAERDVRMKAESWGEAGPMALYLLMCADVLGLAGTASRKRIKEARTGTNSV